MAEVEFSFLLIHTAHADVSIVFFSLRSVDILLALASIAISKARKDLFLVPPPPILTAALTKFTDG